MSSNAFLIPKIPKEIWLLSKVKHSPVKLSFKRESSRLTVEPPPQSARETGQWREAKTAGHIPSAGGLHPAGLALLPGLGCSSGSHSVSHSVAFLKGRSQTLPALAFVPDSVDGQCNSQAAKPAAASASRDPAHFTTRTAQLLLVFHVSTTRPHPPWCVLALQGPRRSCGVISTL